MRAREQYDAALMRVIEQMAKASGYGNERNPRPPISKGLPTHFVFVFPVDDIIEEISKVPPHDCDCWPDKGGCPDSTLIGKIFEEHILHTCGYLWEQFTEQARPMWAKVKDRSVLDDIVEALDE